MSLLSLSRPNLIDGCLSSFTVFFCSIGNTSILLWNMKMLHVRTLNAISVKPSHLYTYLHSGGLAERLNRLQCRQRSAVSFWRHQSLSDASAIRGDLHKSTTSLTKYRFLLTLPLNHHSLTLIMNRFVRLLSWQDSFFFFFLYVILWRRSVQEVITGSELWGLYVGDRKLLASVFYFLFFFFPLCGEPNRLCSLVVICLLIIGHQQGLKGDSWLWKTTTHLM